MRVSLSSSELLHTRVTPGMGRELQTLDSREAMRLKANKADEEDLQILLQNDQLSFLMETTNKLICASGFAHVVWRNALTGRWKLPRSSFNQSCNSKSFFNQLQNGCQPEWIICTANKNISLKSLPLPLRSFLWSYFSLESTLAGVYFVLMERGLKFQMSCKLWVYFNYSWKRPPLRR